MTGEPASSLLDEVVKQAVDAPLREAGFTTVKPLVWSRRQGEVVIVCDVRRRKSREAVEFNLEWGVFVPGYPERAHGTTAPKVSVPASVVIGAVNTLSPVLAGMNGWWVVSPERVGRVLPPSDMTMEQLVGEVRGLVQDSFLPVVSWITTVEDVIGLVRANDLGLYPTGTRGDPETILRSLDTPPPESPGARALDDGWLVVERPDDPEFGDGIAVTYRDDVIGHHRELVEESLTVVQGFPGVSNASFEDTGLILVEGSPDMAALEEALRAWWAAHREQSG